jgi:hypothetical protein
MSYVWPGELPFWALSAHAWFLSRWYSGLGTLHTLLV